jgi:4-azaleucine resistance transporter AzlC
MGNDGKTRTGRDGCGQETAVGEGRAVPIGSGEASAGGLLFTRGGFLRGLRRGIPLGVGSIAFGLVFGVLARQAGLTLAEACLMSALVNAGSSQLVALSMWTTPLPVAAVVAATLLVNLRHVLMGLTLRPWYTRLPAPRKYGTYFFLTDGSWALATVETQRGRPDGAFMLGVGVVMYACWVGATAIGRITGAAIRDPSSWGLDFAFVAVFLALLVSLAKSNGMSGAVQWGLAGAVAIAAHLLLPGNWYVLLGAVAGAAPAVRRGRRA